MAVKSPYHAQFINHTYNSSITAFNVRAKPEGWEKPYLSIEFSNGNSFKKPFYSTEYGLAFSMLQRSCCYNCKFKAGHVNADIILGDCWGLSTEHKAFNRDGTSLIIVKTKKGMNLLNMTEDFFFTEIDYQDISLPAINTILKKNFQRKDYEKYYLKNGLMDTFKLMNSFGYRIRYHLKKKFASSEIENV